MPTPQSYGALWEEYEALKARAFLLLMSEEIPSIDGPLASALFDIVGDTTEQEARKAIATQEDGE